MDIRTKTAGAIKLNILDENIKMYMRSLSILVMVTLVVQRKKTFEFIWRLQTIKQKNTSVGISVLDQNRRYQHEEQEEGAVESTGARREQPRHCMSSHPHAAI